MKKVSVCHIIGGGLSGLACAYFLKKYCPQMHSVIYEADQYLGGRSYSQYDYEWGVNLDNSAHTVLSSDSFMRNFVDDEDWRQNIFFIDMSDMSGSSLIKDNLDIICAKMCNLKEEVIAAPVKKRIEKTFDAKHINQPKFYTFNHDFTQKVINVLASYADEIHCSCCLSKIISRNDRITSLYFGRRKVKLDNDDKIIFALNNAEASEFLKLKKLEYSCSVNISYYTSQTIFLPLGVSFVGLKNGVADWITASSNILSAQVCDYRYRFTTNDKLVLHVWDEISRVRGVNAAFMPPYRLEINNQATLKMTSANNSARPSNAKTDYKNAFICGDWTMKNYPCTMETAVSSGRRAVKTMLNI